MVTVLPWNETGWAGAWVQASTPESNAKPKRFTVPPARMSRRQAPVPLGRVLAKDLLASFFRDRAVEHPVERVIGRVRPVGRIEQPVLALAYLHQKLEVLGILREAHRLAGETDVGLEIFARQLVQKFLAGLDLAFAQLDVAGVAEIVVVGARHEFWHPPETAFLEYDMQRRELVEQALHHHRAAIGKADRYRREADHLGPGARAFRERGCLLPEGGG